MSLISHFISIDCDESLKKLNLKLPIARSKFNMYIFLHNIISSAPGCPWSAYDGAWPGAPAAPDPAGRCLQQPQPRRLPCGELRGRYATVLTPPTPTPASYRAVYPPTTSGQQVLPLNWLTLRQRWNCIVLNCYLQTTTWLIKFQFNVMMINQISIQPHGDWFFFAQLWSIIIWFNKFQYNHLTV